MYHHKEIEPEVIILNKDHKPEGVEIEETLPLKEVVAEGGPQNVIKNMLSQIMSPGNPVH